MGNTEPRIRRPIGRAALLALALTAPVISHASPASSGPETAHRKVRHQPKHVAVQSNQVRAAVRVRHELAHLSNGQSHAVEFFHGPDGLLGVVGKNDKTGKRFIAWASPHGKALILGPVIANGKNLTSYYQHKDLGNAGNPVTRRGLNQVKSSDRPTHASGGQESGAETTSAAARKAQADKPTGAVSARMWQAIQHAHAITIGHGKRNLYVFVDPYCEYCARAIQRLKHPIADGQLTVHYLPVAALGVKSRKAAASLLDTAHPAKAIDDAGSTLIKKPRSARATHAVLQNTGLLAHIAPSVATPTFVYRAAQGNKITYHQGLPAKMATFIQTIQAGGAAQGTGGKQ